MKQAILIAAAAFLSISGAKPVPIYTIGQAHQRIFPHFGGVAYQLQQTVMQVTCPPGTPPPLTMTFRDPVGAFQVLPASCIGTQAHGVWLVTAGPMWVYHFSPGRGTVEVTGPGVLTPVPLAVRLGP